MKFYGVILAIIFLLCLLFICPFYYHCNSSSMASSANKNIEMKTEIDL